MSSAGVAASSSVHSKHYCHKAVQAGGHIPQEQGWLAPDPLFTAWTPASGGGGGGEGHELLYTGPREQLPGVMEAQRQDKEREAHKSTQLVL